MSRFQRCDLPSLPSSTEVLEEIQKKGIKVLWVDTAHCLNPSSGSWELDNIDTVREYCGHAGVAMYKHWRKETQELQIKMLQFATENEIPVKHLLLDECYHSITTDGTKITLQSGQTLPALSSVKMINIATEDGRNVSADEFARLLKFASQSQIIEDFRFQQCELPPTLPASSISPGMISRNFKVSWLDSGHCFDLNLRTWKIGDMDTIRMSCGVGVAIYKQCSSRMHKLQMHLLTVASQNNVNVRHISLRNSYREVDATTGSIILASGVLLPRVSSLGILGINAEGIELTKEDVNGLIDYSSQCTELDFFWCFLPKCLLISGLHDPLISGKLKVQWYPDESDKQCYAVDPASGRWVNTSSKMGVTDKEHQEMLTQFRRKYKK